MNSIKAPKVETGSYHVAALIGLLDDKGVTLREVKEAAKRLADQETNKDIKEDLRELSELKRKESFKAYARSLSVKILLMERKRKEEIAQQRRLKRAHGIAAEHSPAEIEEMISKQAEKIKAAPAPETPTDTLDIALMIKHQKDLRLALEIAEHGAMPSGEPCKNDCKNCDASGACAREKRHLLPVGEIINHTVSGDTIAEDLRNLDKKKPLIEAAKNREVNIKRTNILTINTAKRTIMTAMACAILVLSSFQAVEAREITLSIPETEEAESMARLSKLWGRGHQCAKWAADNELSARSVQFDAISKGAYTAGGKNTALFYKGIKETTPEKCEKLYSYFYGEENDI